MVLLLEETRTPDGWVFGAVSPMTGAASLSRGIAFLQAPCGMRVGLLWHIGEPRLALVAFPDSVGWGVYSVTIEQPVRTAAELGAALTFWLPDLQQRYRELF